MLKLIVIIIAAVGFIWYFFPQFADESLPAYLEANYGGNN